MAVDSILVPSRFNGPRDSGNGGYTSGLVAGALGVRSAEVTLKAPPPLDRALAVERSDEGVVVRDGEVVVAEGREASVDAEPVAPVDPDVAAAASGGGPFVDPAGHPYPTCFVCGPERAEGDGLRIFAGPVDGADGAAGAGAASGQRPPYAAAWTPPASLGDADDRMPDELVWAALDCPSSGPVANHPGLPGFMPIVLGRLSVRLDAPVLAGRPHVVMAWEVEVDGRKRHSAAALYTADGDLCALARALWIELRAPIGSG